MFGTNLFGNKKFGDTYLPNITALLTPGYWQSTYWPASYWMVDYWPEYAVGVYFGILKRWNGSAWAKEPLKTYLAASWQEKPLKRWDGSAWKLIDTTGI